jgi:hypothetical protein
MQQVQLADKLYEDAQRRATEAGFASVDEYVAEVISFDLMDDDGEESSEPKHQFTLEQLADIDKAEAEADAGMCVSSEEVQEYFDRKLAESLKKGGRS